MIQTAFLFVHVVWRRALAFNIFTINSFKARDITNRINAARNHGETPSHQTALSMNEQDERRAKCDEREVQRRVHVADNEWET